MGQNAAAQAAGALGALSVIQGCPAVWPQHVGCALAADAGLQVMHAASANIVQRQQVNGALPAGAILLAMHVTVM